MSRGDHCLKRSDMIFMLWACNLLASDEKLPWSNDEQQSPADSSSNSKSTSEEEASYICDA